MARKNAKKSAKGERDIIPVTFLSLDERNRNHKEFHNIAFSLLHTEIGRIYPEVAGLYAPPWPKTVVALSDTDEVVGSLIRGFCDKTISITLRYLAVHSNYQGRGIGRSMLNYLEESIRPCVQQFGIRAIRTVVPKTISDYFMKFGYRETAPVTALRPGYLCLSKPVR